MNCNEAYKNMYSRHAEMDALSKVSTLKNKPKKVDIIVIKLSISGLMSYSRPCYFCLLQLSKSNFNIRYAYYSNHDGSMVKEIFNKMIDSPMTCVSSGERKRRNIKKFNFDINRTMTNVKTDDKLPNVKNQKKIK